MKLFFAALAILCVASFVSAQDYHEDFDKLYNQLYHSSEPISFDVSYRYYSQATSNTYTDSLRGHCTMFGNKYRYHLSQWEMIQNDQYYLAINSDDKTLAIDKAAGSPGLYSLIRIDSIVKMEHLKVQSLPESHNEKGYKISGLTGEVASMEFWFEKNSYRLTKVLLQYRAIKDNGGITEPKVLIRYSNYKTVSDTNIFSEKNFVYRLGIEWRPVSAYKNYRLIDHSLNN